MNLSAIITKIVSTAKTIGLDVLGLGHKLALVLADVKPLAPQLVSAVSTVVTDVESLVLAIETASVLKGTSPTEDAAVWNAVLTLVNSYTVAEPLIEQAVADIQKDLGESPVSESAKHCS
jgi:hypothetical protein